MSETFWTSVYTRAKSQSREPGRPGLFGDRGVSWVLFIIGSGGHARRDVSVLFESGWLFYYRLSTEMHALVSVLQNTFPESTLEHEHPLRFPGKQKRILGARWCDCFFCLCKKSEGNRLQITMMKYHGL